MVHVAPLLFKSLTYITSLPSSIILKTPKGSFYWWAKTNVKEEIAKLGYRVKYVPHELIKEYNACYRVVYQGKLIYPPAADKLGIPLNEIWISELLRSYERYVLFHELREIKHRAEGCSVEEAHKKALEDEKRAFAGDPLWERMNHEINLAPEDVLLGVKGIGKVLAWRIIRNRPYGSIEELQKVRGIGKKRFKELREHFWCLEERDIENSEKEEGQSRNQHRSVNFS